MGWGDRTGEKVVHGRYGVGTVMVSVGGKERIRFADGCAIDTTARHPTVDEVQANPARFPLCALRVEGLR